MNNTSFSSNPKTFQDVNLSISVIVPTFNREKILKKCLESLVLQSYPKDCFEVIVVDNNSRDCTAVFVLDFIKNHPEIHIKYIKEIEQGLVHSRHSGMKASRYSLLSFTDDDAILSPNWLKEINRFFHLFPDAVAMAGKIQILWDKPPKPWVLKYEYILGKLNYGDGVFCRPGLFINGGNFVILKEILLRLGGFNVDQIGDWLVGDGETGLVRKIHDQNLPIGWNSNALMHHYQVSSQNGTLKDIRRRFVNQGRSDAFDRIVRTKTPFVLALLKIVIGLWENLH